MQDEPWRRLAQQQAGLISRAQLRALGVDRHLVRNQVRAGRWATPSQLVVCTTTGPLSWTQRAWLGILHAPPGSALGGLTAARIHGLRNWDRDEVTVLVRDTDDIPAVDGIRFTRTRRDLDTMRAPGTRAPVCRLEPAVLLFAAYTRSSRTACGLLAAAVQQRRTTPERLLDWIERMRPLRRAKLFRATLHDVAGGSESVAELDVVRMCRRFGLRMPDRQTPRRDARGVWRYTDCEWRLADGRVVVLEVDGAFHMDVENWVADMPRERGLVLEGSVVLRCSSVELRRDPASIARDLRAAGVSTH